MYAMQCNGNEKSTPTNVLQQMFNLNNNMEDLFPGDPLDVLEEMERQCSVQLNSRQNKDFDMVPPKETEVTGKKRTSIMSQLKKRMKQNTVTAQQTQQTQSSMNYSFMSLNETLAISGLSPEPLPPEFSGLPPTLPKLLIAHKGISELYEWQKECLCLDAVRDRQNLIYSLPTSGGKTLVAEILLLKELLCHKKNVLMILPYISIVQEKVRGLSPFAVDLDFLVEEYAASKGQLPPKPRHKRNTVFIATIEKASLLVNSLFDSGRIEELGLLVVDELHLLCEGGYRGAILEVTLTKLKCYAKHVQVIGMSATMPNLKDILKFLNAKSFVGDFRPVELKEYVKVGNEIYKIDPEQKLEQPDVTPLRKLDFKYTPKMKTLDPDYLLGLLSEVIPKHSCLVFCPTKRHCENFVKFVAENLPKQAFTRRLIKEKKALINALLAEGAGKICPTLMVTIPFGLAYHHSGLTMEERRLIEEGYAAGTLCCLACTSTLAAGVNLPAKRVIIRAPYVGIKKLSSTQYRQMVGRAGRAGFDSSGESILMLKDSETRQLNDLLDTMQPSHSTLLDTPGRSLSILVLSLIGLELATSVEGLRYFMSQTLCAIQNDLECVSSITKDTVKELLENKLIRIKNEDKFYITPLGQAAFKSGVDVRMSGKVYNDLKKGLEALTLITHLHLLYLVTPYDVLDMVPIEPDTYFTVYMNLTPDEQQAAKIIGVTESYIGGLMAGRNAKKGDQLTVHRFYISLILYDLWRASNIWAVSKKFNIHRGTVCSLLTSTASFASCISRFCEELSDLWPYCQLLPPFTKQLYHCCSAELIPLMELPSVKQGRARQLYNAGYKSLADVAKASALDMVKAVDLMPKQVANQIIAAAKMLLLEKAEALREEAEDMVEGINCPANTVANKETVHP